MQPGFADPVPQVGPGRDAGRVLRVLALIAVAIGLAAVTAAACALSYSSIHYLATAASVSPRLARLYPLIFDALLVLAGCSVLALRGAGLVSRVYSWLCLLVLLAALAGGGAVRAAAVKVPHRLAGILAAVIPWALVLIGFGLLLALLRYARIRRLGQQPAEAGQDGEPAELVVIGSATAPPDRAAGPAALVPGFTKTPATPGSPGQPAVTRTGGSPEAPTAPQAPVPAAPARATPVAAAPEWATPVPASPVPGKPSAGQAQCRQARCLQARCLQARCLQARCRQSRCRQLRPKRRQSMLLQSRPRRSKRRPVWHPPVRRPPVRRPLVRRPVRPPSRRTLLCGRPTCSSRPGSPCSRLASRRRQVRPRRGTRLSCRRSGRGPPRRHLPMPALPVPVPVPVLARPRSRGRRRTPPRLPRTHRPSTPPRLARARRTKPQQTSVRPAPSRRARPRPTHRSRRPA